MSAFDYHSPRDEGEIIECLQNAKEPVAVLGGGTMLIPELTYGIAAAPRDVMDLSRAGLAGVALEPERVVVGAMTTYSQLCGAGTPVGQELALLTEVAAGITGGPQIRNRGTVGGSASYANPSSDVPACLAVLGARLRLLSPSGTRVVPVADYFVGPFRTVRREDEVLVAIELPADGIRRTGYLKLKHSQSSWPIVTAAAVELGDGAWRVAIGGAADVPVSIDVDSPDAGTEDRAWRQHVRDAAGSGIEAAGGPWSDVLADGDYRLRVAPVVVARAMARAVGGHIPGGA